jgi:hypothetical protein
MNTPLEHPDLEALVIGVMEGDEEILAHARSCEACGAVVEEHRQLEKDLFRIQDPLPPPNFTMAVMAKVANAPAQVGHELRAGLGILFVSVGLFLGFCFSGGNSLGDAGAAIARLVVGARALLIGLARGVEAVWGTATVPLLALTLAILVTSVLGLRRYALAHSSAGISP